MTRRNLLSASCTAIAARFAAIASNSVCPVGLTYASHAATTNAEAFNWLAQHPITQKRPNFKDACKFVLTPAATVQQRIDTADFSGDSSQVRSLNLGYRTLKKTAPPPKDLFRAQAAIHEQACAEGISSAHNATIFFAWHRAFLYFHEQLLRRFSGSASLRVPYWQPGNFLNYPCIYTQDALLDWREFLSDLAPESSNFTKALQFLTTAKNTQDLASGLLVDWHGAVHTWVGGHMGDLDVAALDPLFYAWHSNVDRAWASTDLSSGSMPETWAPFWKFFPEDQKGYWVYANLQDFCCDTKRLGYTYRQLMPKTTKLEPYFELRDLQLKGGIRYNIELRMNGGPPERVRKIGAPGKPTSGHKHLPVAHYWPGDALLAQKIKRNGTFFLTPADAASGSGTVVKDVRLIVPI